MSYRMYEPDGKSRFYLYIILFSSIFFALGMYLYSRPIRVINSCADMAFKTTNLLTKNFYFDPESSFDYKKAKCTEEVLSAKK